ncbi:hypothetical protein MNBD_GAMMA11-303 [hydrothermal vent metagenome]|uniref:Uncharacterized protein n=1 Tax=hydrothermal vent metagenome TaxID=652676 RepID=A0A3B0XHN9_9ZZZZ
MNLQNIDLPVVIVGEHVNRVPALRYAPYSDACFLHIQKPVSSKKSTHISLQHLTLLSSLSERENDTPAGDANSITYMHQLAQGAENAVGLFLVCRFSLCSLCPLR